MKSLVAHVWFRQVESSEHVLFNLTEFLLFKDSERGLAFPFGAPNVFATLFVIPYTLMAEIIFFRSCRYFIMIENEIAGVLAITSEEDGIYISTIGIERNYRRHGIAGFVLDRVERLASQRGKRRLELSVLKRNTPAQRLYAELGFSKKSETAWSLILQKNIKTF